MLKSTIRMSVCGATLLAVAGCGTQVGQSASRDFNAAITQIGSGSLFSDGYLDDKTDACYARRQALAEEGSFFDPEIVQSTLLGAGSGVVVALLTGENVLAGAAIGAGLGLAAGYLGKLQQEGLNGTQIASRASSDVRKDNEQIDDLIRSFDQLSDCRKGEGATIQAAFNNGNIDQATAKEQMAGVRARFAEDRAKFKEIAEQISDKSENNAAIYNDIAADSGGKALEVQAYNRGQQSARVTRAPAQKTAGTKEGSLTADKSEVDALQRECLTNVKKRDDCFDKVAEAEEVEGDLELDLS
ncbi:MAG: hypothetical protein AAF367_00625 [Pseudomonadota bacterium]